MIERFLDKVEITEDCWLWRASMRNQYGGFDVDGKTRAAHRVSYELFVGPVPDGLQLDHLCCNKSCVNPAHLEPVTPGENIKRAWRVSGRVKVCKRGHAMTPENTEANGHKRRCLACRQFRSKLYRQQAKETRLTSI